MIAGSAKRISLKTPKGLDTRPTTDRIKETLFNMLQYDLADCCFLDLFAGSGGIGIEALSRGAKRSVFVDQSRDAAECIRENLQTTRLSGQAEVMQCDVLTALRRLEGNYCFDYIFMDPPYGMLLEKKALAYLADSGLIRRESMLIVEARLEEDFSYLESMGFLMEKEKDYKSNKHIFIYRERKNDGSGLSGEF